MNWAYAIGEGIMMSLVLGLISKRADRYRTAVYVLSVIFEIYRVVAVYSHQEDSFLFFIHPYLVFFISDISDYASYRRGILDRRSAAYEKLLVWPLVIIPVMSGFVLTAGWLIKLYGKNLILYIWNG